MPAGPGIVRQREPGDRPHLPRDAAAASADGRARLAPRASSTWTDSVAIAGENETLAMRHRTNDDRLILPTELPSESRAVWRRHGRCKDVLAELFELPDPDREAT